MAKYPKPTKSVDGRYRMSVRVEFRIDRDMMVNVLTRVIDDVLPIDDSLDSFDIRSALSKAAIFKALKSGLRDKGDTFAYMPYGDAYHDEETIDNIRAWADKNISIYFPELDKE